MKNSRINFTNWTRPSLKQLEQEYKVEYEIKALKSITDNAWPTLQDFLDSADAGQVITVTPQIDAKISYRSGTGTKDELLSLIRSYRSYPEFRNEKTIDAIYEGFQKNKAMTMPIVLKFKNGSMRVMGGNTRMDVAFQLGINPKVLLITVP